MKIEVVVTGHDAWWWRLINWLGADLTWGHALLRICPANAPSYIIEAEAKGVIKRDWSTAGWQRYARFKLIDDPLPDTALGMMAFAEGEVGKRYKYEALPIIAKKIIEKILRRITRKYAILYIGRGEVCTSLVDRVFLFGKYDLVPGETSPFVLPDEIAESELLERIEYD